MDPVEKLPTLDYSATRRRVPMPSSDVWAMLLCTAVGITFIVPAAAYFLTTSADDRSDLIDACGVFVGLFGLLFTSVGVRGLIGIGTMHQR